MKFINRPDSYWIKHGLLLLLTAVATVSLYWPFLDNGIVFDDHLLFTNLSIYDHAIKPFSLAPRIFPYFTLGIVQVLTGSIEANRVVSLALHLLNTLLIFRLLERWSRDIGQIPAPRALLLAFLGSVFFAIHPVAVYGAGYLAQRTILFATLFSLLTLWFYWRSLVRNSIADAIAAALFYTLAIYSKEHAIMLPLAAVMLNVLHPTTWRQNIAKTTVFVSLCLPPAILVFMAVKGVIGTAYENDAASFISNITAADTPAAQWLVSAVTQTGLFFQYIKIWLIPDTGGMAADIRIDFNSGWNAAWIVTRITAYFAFAAGGVVLLRCGGKSGLIGWGMLYFWLLFATELVSIRFQEPFILYRSYLWAPGIILALFTLLNALNARALVIGAVLVAPILFISAQDRLRSLRDDFSLWNDAAEKLTSISIPGSDRIYYNRGAQYLQKKQYREAIADLGNSIQRNPGIFQSYQQRGLAYSAIGDYPHALADFDRAIALDHNQGLSHYGRATALGKLGYTEEMLQELRISRDLGYLIADFTLKNYMKTGKTTTGNGKPQADN